MNNNTYHQRTHRPVEELLGRKTLQVLVGPDRVESYILEDRVNRQNLGFAGCTILSEGPNLAKEQVARLRQYVLTPEAHDNGEAIYRRLPSVPNFAFRIWLAECVLDVLVDLHNPGWEFHCNGENYQNWNCVGSELICLAKELFPQLASSHSRSVWQNNAIKMLKTKESMTDA